MKSINWFIIYIILLMLVPTFVFLQTGRIIGRFSLKNNDVLLSKTKKQVKQEFDIKNSDDISNNKSKILNKFSREKYKIFLLKIRNILIGGAGGYSLSPLSVLNKNSKQKSKDIEKWIKASLSTCIIGLLPLLYLIYTLFGIKGKISFKDSNYFGELFELIIGIVSGYLFGYFQNESKDQRSNYKSENSNGINHTILLLCVITFMIMFFIYFTP